MLSNYSLNDRSGGKGSYEIYESMTIWGMGIKHKILAINPAQKPPVSESSGGKYINFWTSPYPHCMRIKRRVKWSLAFLKISIASQMIVIYVKFINH